MNQIQPNNISKYLSYIPRIEVCGGIASGKTTFAALMQRIGIKTIFEDFYTNPFWEAFYSNPGKYIFETETTFMLQHYHQIKKEHDYKKISTCDFSFFLDLSYAKIGLKGSKLNTFMMLYEEVKKEISLPILLVYLYCDTETELERIRKRGRSVESSITYEFLDLLNKAIECEVVKAKEIINVITINSSEKNFANYEFVKQEMIDCIIDALHHMCPLVRPV